MYRVLYLPCSRAASPLALLGALALYRRAQEVLPEIVVQAQRPAPPRPTAAAERSAKSDLASKNTKFDEARDNLSPRFGASSFDLNRAAIESMPQGIDTPIDKVLLQAPGVSQDSAAAGDIHVRNEHAQRAVPHQRHHVAGWHFRFRPRARYRFHRQPGGDHRRAAGAIRLAHGRRRRHPDQERQFAGARRQDRHLRRQPRNADAELRLRRTVGQHRIFLLRPRLHQRRGHRKSDAKHERDP